MRTGSWLLALLCLATVMAVPPAAAEPLAGGHGSFSSAVPVCGVIDPSARPQRTTAAPRVIRPGGSVDDLVISDELIYVSDLTRHVIRVLTLDGTPVRTIDVGTDWGLAVEPGGAVYTVSADFELVRRSVDGTVAWRRPWRDVLSAPPTAIAGLMTADGWRLVVSDRSSATDAYLFDSSGTLQATAPWGTTNKGRVTGMVDGGVLVRSPGDVRRYGPTGDLVARFGSSPDVSARTGAPMPIHDGQALVAPDGSLLLPTGYQGIVVVDASGVVTGVVDDTVLGRLTQNPAAALIGSDLYYASGGPWSGDQTISVLSVDTVLALARPLDKPVLGLGAGLVAPADDNWFPTGSTPEVRAVFDRTWADRPGSWSLSYTVRSAAQVRAGVTVTSESLPLQAVTADGEAALTLPRAETGYYEVDARLLQDGVPVSATCLHYAVGAPDHRLALPTLPAGADAGGPAPARAVALADVLGTGAARVQLDWSRLYVDGRFDWSAYDADLAAAAAEASRRSVTLVVQVGQGGPERALVDEGTWAARVRDVVAHYRGQVSVWEAWNEPNATFGAPSDYVTRVLTPFYQAVKAADPDATVIGGSVVGMDLGYWRGIVAAGGLSALDVAGIHPYSGHNRSYEEQGTPEQMQQLSALLEAGKPGIRVWNTELAWWSNGSFDLWAQADYSARAQLWHRAMGIDRWAYFIPEGNWGNDGVTFSAIQVDDYVKPAALALMTSRSVLADRPFLGWASQEIPFTFAARYGPTATSNQPMMALWTDDLRTQVRLRPKGKAELHLTLVDQLGRRSSLTVPSSGATLPVSGSVSYLVGRGADQVTVTSERPGRNALIGATATASNSQPSNPAEKAVDGVAVAADNAQEWTQVSAWASAPGDSLPWLSLNLRERSVVDRVLVTSHSIGSVAPGLRTYTIDVRDGADSPWIRAGHVEDAFFERSVEVSFDARPVTDVRVTVESVNYSGYNGGAPPPWWPMDSTSAGTTGSSWAAPAIVVEVQAISPVLPASSSRPSRSHRR